jgi:hypothetical protein
MESKDVAEAIELIRRLTSWPWHVCRTQATLLIDQMPSERERHQAGWHIGSATKGSRRQSSGDRQNSGGDWLARHAATAKLGSQGRRRWTLKKMGTY